jgi:hypothetical protein
MHNAIVAFATSKLPKRRAFIRQELCCVVLTDLGRDHSRQTRDGGLIMSIAEGFFVDWDGNARSTLDPGGGYLCETDPVARYVAITTKGGTLVHEGTFYKTMGDIERAGIKASFVPGTHPWGKPEEGF